MSISAWFSEQRATFFGNAQSVRELRSQLRGTKAIALWGCYLVTLITIVLLSYTFAEDQLRQFGIASAQGSLRNMYNILMSALTVALSVIIPSIAAGTIIVERQRKSLDLVFSAPVEPKYFLIGKMISNVRYSLMLLTLALPTVATCVLLGGATWVDLLGAFMCLLGYCLTLTSIGLNVSSTAKNPTAAIVSSLAMTFLLNVLLFLVSFTLSMATLMTGARADVNPLSALSPFMAAELGGANFTLGAVTLPVWVYILAAHLVFSRYLLIGAESILAPFFSTAVMRLRLATLALLVLGSWVTTAAVIPRSSLMDSRQAALFLSVFVLASVAMAFFVPFAKHEIRRHTANGWFSWGSIKDGTPAGALPFMLLVVVAVFTPPIFWCSNQGYVLAIAVYALAFVILTWGLQRFFGRNSKTITTARTNAIIPTISCLAFVTVISIYVSQLAREASVPVEDYFQWLPWAPFFAIAPKAEVFIPTAVIGVAAGLWLGIVAERKASQTR